MKNRKIVGLILAVIMLLGLLPVTAFAAVGDFNHIAFFEEDYQGKQAIVAAKIALTGEVDSMLLSDIKDFKMTLDGEPIDVRLVDTADTLNMRTEWWNDSESGTSFLFDLSERLTEPGMYRVSFTYKGQTCTGMHPLENAFEHGQSAPDDAILIGTEAELRAFAEAVNRGDYFMVSDAYAKLTQDIVLTGEWTPIGEEFESGEGLTSTNGFYGTFDGGGHSITGLKIGSKENPSTLVHIGLFAFAPKNVLDLSLEVEIYAARENRGDGIHAYCSHSIGGLAASSNGTVKNCTVSGIIEVEGVYAYVGGLIGDAATVIDCSSSVTIQSQGAVVGGLIGAAGGSIIGCYATGDVSGETVGGLAGVSGGYIDRCYATGNVTAKPRINEYEGTQYCMGSAGGFCGYIGMNIEDDIISSCFASGNVAVLESGIECNGGCNAGGFAGSIDASYGSVENCYATGDVRGNSAAGFAADVMSSSPDGSWGGGTLYISHCFASGNVVSETGSAAGFVSSSIGAWLYDCASIGDVTAKGDAKGFASEFGFAGIERCWSVGDVTSQEGYASIFGAGKNCYAIGNAIGKDAQGDIGEYSYFAGTLAAAPNDDGTPKTFKLGDSSYADTTLFPAGYDESVKTGKTTAEMQSQAFVDLLNSDGPGKPWRYKAGSYPVLPYDLLPVSASSTPGGTLHAPPFASAGDEVVLFAVPGGGYQLKSLQVNGAPVDGMSFVMPEGEAAISAEFEPASANGEANPQGDNTSNPGSMSNGVGDTDAATNPINPAIFIGGGVLLLCLLAALAVFIIRRKNK